MYGLAMTLTLTTSTTSGNIGKIDDTLEQRNHPDFVSAS